MVTSDVLRRVVVGSAAVTALAATSVLALPATASVTCQNWCSGYPESKTAGLGQPAAPVANVASMTQVVGSNGAPLVNLNLPCTAPWNQGGVLGAKYNACNTAPTFQVDGPQAGASQDSPGSTAGFGQVAAAPVYNTAPIYQIVGSNGAPLVNLNLPCTAPWQQGGALGAKYNACSTAPVNQ